MPSNSEGLPKRCVSAVSQTADSSTNKEFSHRIKTARGRSQYKEKSSSWPDAAVASGKRSAIHKIPEITDYGVAGSSSTVSDDIQINWQYAIQSACERIWIEADSLRKQAINQALLVIKGEHVQALRNAMKCFERTLQEELKKIEVVLQEWAENQLEQVREAADSVILTAMHETFIHIENYVQRAMDVARNDEQQLSAQRTKCIKNEFEEQMKRAQWEASDAKQRALVQMQEHMQHAVDAATHETLKTREMINSQQQEYGHIVQQLKEKIETLESENNRLNRKLRTIVHKKEQLEEESESLRDELQQFVNLAFKASDLTMNFSTQEKSNFHK